MVQHNALQNYLSPVRFVTQSSFVTCWCECSPIPLSILAMVVQQQSLQKFLPFVIMRMMMKIKKRTWLI